MNYSKEDIQNRFRNLEESIKESLTSLENFELIINLGKNLNLTEAQSKEIYNEFTWVLLGFKKVEDFKNSIQTIVNNEDLAIKISREVTEKIFNPLKEHINNSNIINNNSSKETGISSENIESSNLVMVSTNNEPLKPLTENNKQIVEIPNYSSYESGKDPYREPIE